MKVTSKVYVGKVKEINNKAISCLVKTADALRTDLIQSQTMPFDTGTLQNVKTTVDDSNKDRGSVRVVSDTPYARRLYFHPEYNFQKDKNANAGGMWFEPYINGAKKDFAKNTFAELMKRSM